VPDTWGLQNPFQSLGESVAELGSG
jgi:hypothetical protein